MSEVISLSVMAQGAENTSDGAASVSSSPEARPRKDVVHLGRWTVPREPAVIAVAFFTCLAIGLNDSATGANLPSIQEHYGLTYQTVSLTFLGYVLGYFISSATSSTAMHHLGMQRTLLLSSAVYAGGAILAAVAPPYPALVFALVLLGSGGGLYDTAASSAIAHFENGPLMSIVYSSFAVGSLTAPFIIGALAQHGAAWNLYYWFPCGLAALLAPVQFITFASYSPKIEENPQATTAAQCLRRSLRLPTVWVGGILILLMFTLQDTFSSWIVEYLLQVKHAQDGLAQYQLSGFWGGVAIGRIALAYPSHKLGARLSNTSLTVLAAGLLGIIWGVKDTVGVAVAVAFVGVFIGPIIPNIISLVSNRAPPSIKNAVVSLIIGMGLLGSAVGPLVFGQAAQFVGVDVLPGLIIVLVGLCTVGFLCMPPEKVKQ